MVLNRMRRWGQRAVLTMAAATMGTTFESCASEDAWRIFRDSASPAIGEGLKTVFDGVVDGVVAVVDPSEHSTSSTSGNST